VLHELGLSICRNERAALARTSQAFGARSLSKH